MNLEMDRLVVDENRRCGNWMTGVLRVEHRTTLPASAWFHTALGPLAVVNDYDKVMVLGAESEVAANMLVVAVSACLHRHLAAVVPENYDT